MTYKQISAIKLEACLEECLSESNVVWIKLVNSLLWLPVVVSAVQYGARCLAALYYPNDKECSLLQENRFSRPELFLKNNASFAVNYYEVSCLFGDRTSYI